MIRSQLTAGHRWTVASLAVGVGLLASACGATPGATPGQTQQSSSAVPAATKKFCDEAQAAMAGLSGKDPSNSMSLTQARATLDSLLTTGITNFTVLEGEAPASVKNSITIIVADFRSYKAQADKATSVKQLLDSSVTANPVQRTSYQELLSYLSDTCQ